MAGICVASEIRLTDKINFTQSLQNQNDLGINLSNIPFNAQSSSINNSTNFSLLNNNNSYFPVYEADKETFSKNNQNLKKIFPNSNGLLV